MPRSTADAAARCIILVSTLLLACSALLWGAQVGSVLSGHVRSVMPMHGKSPDHTSSRDTFGPGHRCSIQRNGAVAKASRRRGMGYCKRSQRLNNAPAYPLPPHPPSHQTRGQMRLVHPHQGPENLSWSPAPAVLLPLTFCIFIEVLALAKLIEAGPKVLLRALSTGPTQGLLPPGQGFV